MSSFKRINKSDVVVLPYIANKQWSFNLNSLVSNGINIFNGQPFTTSFDPNTDYITNGQYDRLVFDSINHQYYQQFTGSVLNNAPNLQSNNYLSSSIYRPSASYYQMGNINNMIRQFPSGSNPQIKVISIPKKLYSNRISPGTFNFSSSFVQLTDDGQNNVFDTSGSNNAFVGNIFYEQGIVVITDPNYQSLVPLPPFALRDNVIFYQQSASKVIYPLLNDDPRSGTILTGSIQISGSNASMFTVVGDGSVTFSGSIPGQYYTYYTVSSSYSGSTLISNPAVINVSILPTFYYYNSATSSIFQKNNCGTAGTGSFVTYNVPYAKYSSSTSQFLADSQSLNDIQTNGQNYANSVGSCGFFNLAQSASFQKNNCGGNSTGSVVLYSVPAGQFQSTISQTDANNQAIAFVNSHGQIFANDAGTCTWYSNAQTVLFQKNNCGPYSTGSFVTYSIAPNVFSSSISQYDADSKASAYVAINGQANANALGTCAGSLVTINWSNFQTPNSQYVDSNLQITEYVPASNPTGTVRVNEFLNNSGSFTSNVGNRLVFDAWSADPWPATGSSTQYLVMNGQVSSIQSTTVSGSHTTSSIILSNNTLLVGAAFTTFTPPPPPNVNINWKQFQIQGTRYVDNNVIITRYSPASNPVGTTVVASYVISTGSFSASTGDRLDIVSFAGDPWPTDGIWSTNMLNIGGQSQSFQYTYSSGSPLTASITLYNTADVNIEGFASSGDFNLSHTNVISGSLLTQLLSAALKINLFNPAPVTSSFHLTGKWAGTTTSGSWYVDYLIPGSFTSSLSGSGYVSVYDSVTNAPVTGTNAAITTVDKGVHWVGYPTNIGDLSTLYNFERFKATVYAHPVGTRTGVGTATIAIGTYYDTGLTSAAITTDNVTFGYTVTDNLFNQYTGSLTLLAGQSSVTGSISIASGASSISGSIVTSISPNPLQTQTFVAF